jgi:hypothetical protein
VLCPVAGMHSFTMGKEDGDKRVRSAVQPPPFRGVITSMVSEVLAPVFREEISSLLQHQAIQVVPVSEVQSGWCSWYFLLPKSNHLKVCMFKMLTLRWLLQSVRPSDWFTSIDLKDVAILYILPTESF